MCLSAKRREPYAPQVPPGKSITYLVTVYLPNNSNQIFAMKRFEFKFPAAGRAALVRVRTLRKGGRERDADVRSQQLPGTDTAAPLNSQLRHMKDEN